MVSAGAPLARLCRCGYHHKRRRRHLRRTPAGGGARVQRRAGGRLQRPLAGPRRDDPNRDHGAGLEWQHERRSPGEGQDRAGLLRRTGPERRQYAGALAEYGIAQDRYHSDAEMFDLVHAMRTRVMTSPAFDGSRILAAILFQQTMERDVDGLPTARYLWERKNVVPFLKVDLGLAAEKDGVQLMKPIDTLDDVLEQANQHGIFGTKMRSVIKDASETGISAIVEQQFGYADRIRAAGPGPDHRAGGQHRQPAQGAGGGPAEGRPAQAGRGAAVGRADHGQAHHPDAARPVRRPGVRSAGGARARPVRRLQPRRGLHPAGAGPRHDRQLLPGAARRAHRRPDRRAVQRAGSTRRSPQIYQASVVKQ